MNRTEFWHMFGGESEGLWAYVLIGPSPHGPDDTSKAGAVIREVRLPHPASDNGDRMPWLASWTHEPTHDEKQAHVPEEFRDDEDDDE